MFLSNCIAGLYYWAWYEKSSSVCAKTRPCSVAPTSEKHCCYPAHMTSTFKHWFNGCAAWSMVTKTPVDEAKCGFEALAEEFSVVDVFSSDTTTVLQGRASSIWTRSTHAAQHSGYCSGTCSGSGTRGSEQGQHVLGPMKRWRPDGKINWP